MKTGLAFLAGFALALAASADPVDWDRAEQVQTGVRLVRREYTTPRLMKAVVARIDLKTPGIRFTGTHRDAKWGEPMPDFTNSVKAIRTRRQTTADFMLSERAKGRDVIVAFNSAPWSPWCKPWNHKYGDPSRLNVTEGVVISDHGQKRNHLFVAWNDGRCEIVENIPSNRYEHVQVAHSGFDILMKDGRPTADASRYSRALHPRMVYGLSRDGRYLFVLAIDGRQEGWSLGADQHDMIGMMREAGASDVVNMDGGGSTTLVYWDGCRPVMANRHEPSGKICRANGMNIAVYLDAARASAR